MTPGRKTTASVCVGTHTAPTALPSLRLARPQVRMVKVGSEIAAMLRTYRAADVRDKITGVHRRSPEQPAGAVGSAGGAANDSGVGRAGVPTAGEGSDEEALFGGVRIDTQIQEGLVRGNKTLRGWTRKLARPCCGVVVVVVFFAMDPVLSVGCVPGHERKKACFFLKKLY